jgi:hypothetical protein
MTDQQVPPPPIDEPPPPPPVTPPPPVRQGSKLVPVIILGVIFAFLGIVLYMVKDAGSAGDLKVGECFDLPTSSSVSTVNTHPCTEPHDAEVFHVAEVDDPSITSPITFALNRFVSAECGPVFETYVGAPSDGTPELSVGYFYPSFAGWDDGDRTITCYVSNADDTKLSQSVKGSAGT